MPQVEAVLFDLDDTLLGNDMDLFLQSYFPMLSNYVQPIINGERFLTELMTATQAMITSEDPDLTNREVFWSVFCRRTGLVQEEVERFTDKFYREKFPELANKTKRRPVARKLIQFCFDHDLPVVIATNPLFPLAAIYQRLEWGGISAEEFDYSLITSYENMHSSKPHTSYYVEIIERLGLTADRSLMVGDDWENDIVPADQLGFRTYWIADERVERSHTNPDAQGSLDELYERFRTGWLRA